MEDFIQSLIEGFDFGALSAMDDQPSDFSNALSEHMFKDQMLGEILLNMKSAHREEYIISENYSECETFKFNKFIPKYCICEKYASWSVGNRKRMIAGFTIDGTGTVDVILNGEYDLFTTYINAIYSVLNKHHITTNNLYVTRSTDANVSKILSLSGEGLDTPFKNLNFDNLPSHIYVVNQTGEAFSDFICVYNLASSATVDDIVSFESYVDSLDENIAVQYEISSSTSNDVIEYIEGTVYMKSVNNPDEILKQNKIKMTQKDCDRVSDLIKQRKDAYSQANAITQLTKAVSRFVWYCKLAHVNPAIFKAAYKNEHQSFFYINTFSGRDATNRILAFNNCRHFYSTALSLGLTDDIMYAAYSKTFAEDNADNSNRQLTNVNYGSFTPFMLFIDNLKVPYTLDRHNTQSYYNSYKGYWGGYSTMEYVELTLLDDNSFTIERRSHEYTIEFDHDCDLMQWLKTNVENDYGFKNIRPRISVVCTLQKLRTYILKFLKDKKAGKI